MCGLKNIGIPVDVPSSGATSRDFVARLGTREVDEVSKSSVQEAEYFVEQFSSKSKSNLNWSITLSLNWLNLRST